MPKLNSVIVWNWLVVVFVKTKPVLTPVMAEGEIVKALELVPVRVADQPASATPETNKSPCRLMEVCPSAGETAGDPV
jgi:hypothetical protein